MRTSSYQPLISVITPTYNHEAYIAECIRSVQAQTYPCWEMLIVDDGSTDRTGEIVRELARDDARIKYLWQENAGIAQLQTTYNRALEAAQGEVVAILEGDDWWPPYKLFVQAPDFGDPEVVLSSGLSRIVTDGDHRIHLIPADLPSEDVQNNRPVGRAAMHMVRPESLTYTFPVSTMVRTSTMRKIGGFQQPPYLPVVDFPTFLRLTLEGEFRFHPDICGCWRRHRTSVTHSRLSEILDNAYRHAFEFLREHRGQIPATDEELDALERRWDEIQAMHCILRGRLLNHQGKRKLASRAFREAALYRTARRTVMTANLAATLSAMGLPVEPIYRMAGRIDLDSAITLGTGDQVVSERDLSRPRVVGRWRR